MKHTNWKKRPLAALLALCLALTLCVPAMAEGEPMTASAAALALIEESEGFRAEKYLFNGKWYIGFGTQCEADEYPGGVTREEAELLAWVRSLPEPVSGEMAALYREMIALQTPEAKLYKAMDKLEAIVQHNESDIATWEPHEYQLNMTYADDAVAWSPVLRELREAIRNDTKAKIAAAEQQA